MNKKLVTILSLSTLLLGACGAANSSGGNSQQTSPTSHQTSQTLSNSDKAIAVLKSFETGDEQAITDYVSPDQYIQHNLTVPDGRDVVLAAIGQLSAAGTTVEVVRSFEDGDLIVLHSKYKIADGPEQAGFDIFRFEKGLIVEHWDNLQDIGAVNPSGHTLLDGETKVTDTDQTAANKKLVRQFVTDILVHKELDKAKDYFHDNAYIQHNPQTGEGADATIAGFQGIIDSGFDMTYTDIRMVIGQGNFILVVSQGSLMGTEAAYYDLFRGEDGKIAEHWDIVSTIPAKDTWANQNGKF